MKICIAEDAVLLQNDLTQVDVWSQANSMTLNLDKSSCITFNRNKSPVLHTYSIRDSISSTKASFGHRTNTTLWMILRRYRDVSCDLLGFVLVIDTQRSPYKILLLS
ncbi:hypothetical protein J6590_072078 [Homalodisca vitripennis]|nr:hypothetical protein J6590_072078 [Homalodisca vitripennis]